MGCRRPRLFVEPGTSADRDWNLDFEKNNFLNEWKFTKTPIKDPLKQLKCSVLDRLLEGQACSLRLGKRRRERRPRPGS